MEWLTKVQKDAYTTAQTMQTPDFRYGLHAKLLFMYDLAEVGKTKHPRVHQGIEKTHQSHIGTLATKDKFFYTNLAHADIEAITIPEGAEQTLTLNKQAQCTHLVIVVRPHAKLTLVQTLEGKEAYKSAITELILEENAQVNMVTLQKTESKTQCISGTYASLGTNAKIRTYEVSLGGAFVKSEILTQLRGAGAQAETHILSLGANTQHIVITPQVFHYAEKTKSTIFLQGILNHKAKAVYNALTTIGPKAHDSEGYQKKEIVMLSKDVEVNAIPNLDIQNKQTKCTHGVSIGSLEKETLFYLTSRGITLHDYAALLTEGFLAKTPVLQSEPLYAHIHAKLT